MFVEFIQEGNRLGERCRWSVSGLMKTDQSQASKYLVGEGRNQMTFFATYEPIRTRFATRPSCFRLTKCWN